MLLSTKSRLTLFVVVPACLLALGACSSSAKTSKPSGTFSYTTAPNSLSTPGATSSDAKAVGCSLVSADQVASTLGIQAQAPTSEPNGSVTVCLYASSTNPRSTTIRYETGVSTSDFATGRQQFDANSEKTTTVNGVGDQAYSSSIGNVNSLAVLKGDTAVLISAPASPAKIQALAEQILPKL